MSLLEGEVDQLRAEKEKNEAEYSKKLAELESLLAAAGKTDVPSSDSTEDTSEPSPFTYTVENGGAVITGYSGNYSVLVIPEKLGEYNVTAIADSVFSGNTKLTSVSIPSGVTRLGWFAFSGCTSLKSLTIPDTVTEIGYDAFAYCKGLTIYCSSGTYAERFASSYGIGCVAS
ncbi:MAG: leucine-rich repeat domain-containing protein [Clostridia bacterium]|nr:leucine-rich repeat domain-containing protein [Clostridia bacterium]